jgi:hypothetical protein
MIYRLGKMENSRKLHMTGWNLGRTSYGMLVARYLWKLKSEKNKKDQNGRPTKFWGGGGGGAVQILWWPSCGVRPYLLPCNEIVSFLWWCGCWNSCSVPSIITLTIFILRLSCFEVLLIKKLVIFPNYRSVSPVLKLPYSQSLFKLVGCDFSLGLQFALFLLFGFCNRS